MKKGSVRDSVRVKLRASLCLGDSVVQKTLRQIKQKEKQKQKLEPVQEVSPPDPVDQFLQDALQLEPGSGSVAGSGAWSINDPIEPW